MGELFVFTLLPSSLLLAIHLGLRVHAFDLERTARTAPELGLRPRFAVVAARASMALLALALLPLLAAALGLTEPSGASMLLFVFGLCLFPIVPLLFAISRLATPRQQQTREQQIGQLLLWVLAFGFGLCHAAFWLPILAR